jgi:hypothetical protein
MSNIVQKKIQEAKQRVEEEKQRVEEDKKHYRIEFENAIRRAIIASKWNLDRGCLELYVHVNNRLDPIQDRLNPTMILQYLEKHPIGQIPRNIEIQPCEYFINKNGNREYNNMITNEEHWNIYIYFNVE